MNITDANPRKRKIAIQLFCEDLDALVYNDIAFHIEQKGEQKVLCATAVSDHLPENTTRMMAVKNILQAKHVLQTLKQESKDFHNYVNTLEVTIRFVYDHGKWCTLLAQEESGNFEWIQ